MGPNRPRIEPPAPLEMSARHARVGLVVVLLIAAALVGKQICLARIVTRDAAGYYLPLAKAMAADGWGAAQHPTIPPLLPILAGWASRATGWADDPQELAGRLVSGVSFLCTVAGVYLVGCVVGGRRVGLTAAALTGCHPRLARLGAAVGPEMLYAAWLTFLVWLLLRYRREPTAGGALCVGGAAAMVALARSEGLFLCLLGLGIAVAVSLRRIRTLKLRAPGHVLILVAVVGAIWWPRLRAVHRLTGYYVLDARVMHLPGMADRTKAEWFRAPCQVLTEADRRRAPSPPAARPWRKTVAEAWNNTVTGLGPVGMILAAVWFLPIGRMRVSRAEQLLPAAFVFLQVALILPVQYEARYLGPIAGLVQVWAGLGAVAFAERLREGKGAILRWGESIPMQLAVLAVVAVALACVSVFGTNQGTRHRELRTLGRRILRERGPGRVILARSAESAYYAAGKMLATANHLDDRGVLSRRRARRLRRDYGVDLIVVRHDAAWCPWLVRGAPRGGGMLVEPPPEAVVARQGRGGVVVYVVDAARALGAPELPAQ